MTTRKTYEELRSAKWMAPDDLNDACDSNRSPAAHAKPDRWYMNVHDSDALTHQAVGGSVEKTVN